MKGFPLPHRRAKRRQILLMNTLLDKERAIVSHIPGTTRDILEDHMRLNGLNFKLMDTAGIRMTDEVIEQEGIRRSKEAMQKADLILLVLDAAQEARRTGSLAAGTDAARQNDCRME